MGSLRSRTEPVSGRRDGILVSPKATVRHMIGLRKFLNIFAWPLPLWLAHPHPTPLVGGVNLRARAEPEPG